MPRVLDQLGVGQLTFSSDGRRLASCVPWPSGAGLPASVAVWDAASGRERRSYDWQIGGVRSVAFAPDGLLAAAGGKAGIVVWDVEEGAV